jgi:hypothetical protein
MPEMADRIRATVAQILTVRELVLNKGAADGVELGMRFAVLNKRGADIVDPETGQPLGSVELPKVQVKVIRLYDHLSVARTFRVFTTRAGPMYAANLLSVFGAPPTSRVETFRTDEHRLQDELDEKESFVKIGDPAVQVVGDEFGDDADLRGSQSTVVSEEQGDGE